MRLTSRNTQVAIPNWAMRRQLIIGCLGRFAYSPTPSMRKKYPIPH